MTAPAYRYRASRSHRGRPAGGDGCRVDEVKVRRACSGERVDLTAAERREAVRLLAFRTGCRPKAAPAIPLGQLAPMSSNEIARRLDLSWRSVQRIRAALRREASGG